MEIETTRTVRIVGKLNCKAMTAQVTFHQANKPNGHNINVDTLIEVPARWRNASVSATHTLRDTFHVTEVKDVLLSDRKMMKFVANVLLDWKERNGGVNKRGDCFFTDVIVSKDGPSEINIDPPENLRERTRVTAFIEPSGKKGGTPSWNLTVQVFHPTYKRTQLHVVLKRLLNEREAVSHAIDKGVFHDGVIALLEEWRQGGGKNDDDVKFFKREDTVTSAPHRSFRSFKRKIRILEKQMKVYEECVTEIRARIKKAHDDGLDLYPEDMPSIFTLEDVLDTLP